MIYIGLDPSTKTGIVAMDEHGEVLIEKEITSKLKDPARMWNISECVMDNLIGLRKSKIAIEGFSYGSQGNAQSIQYGLGWLIRCKLYHESTDYTEIAPQALKKFVTGKGNVKKDVVRLEVYKRWGYEHKSDNVIDAYVLAQITRHIGEGLPLTKFQGEVIKIIQKEGA